MDSERECQVRADDLFLRDGEQKAAQNCRPSLI